MSNSTGQVQPQESRTPLIWVAVLILIAGAALVLWSAATHVSTRPGIDVETSGASVHIGNGGISVTTAPSHE